MRRRAILRGALRDPVAGHRDWYALLAVEKTPLGDWTARALDLALTLFVSGAALALLGELALTVLGS